MRMQHKLHYDVSTLYEANIIKNYFNEIHIHSKGVFFQIVHDNILNQFHTGEV